MDLMEYLADVNELAMEWIDDMTISDEQFDNLAISVVAVSNQMGWNVEYTLE
jgi:hypothetical protein